jgi:hypothetical protein
VRKRRAKVRKRREARAVVVAHLARWLGLLSFGVIRLRLGPLRGFFSVSVPVSRRLCKEDGGGGEGEKPKKNTQTACITHPATHNARTSHPLQH